MEPMRPGKLLNEGRYRIKRELNRGATAVVYEGHDLVNHCTVALKVMNAADGHMSVPLKIVKREVEYASSMCHSNIVRLLDVFAEGKQLILVWELISGPDLLDLLNECSGRMPEDVAAFYFYQLTRGVVFMHENGFCHRDLKPENCMVDKTSSLLKIIDFGLSKHINSVNTLGVGTPDYMCPEMLAAAPSVTSGAGPKYDAKAVDVWAMGVMLYLLVTGVYPFEDPQHPNSLSHTLQNVKAGRMQPFPPHVDSECGALITRMLQRDPRKRISLKDISQDPWVINNAKAHAEKIGHPELCSSANAVCTDTQRAPDETSMQKKSQQMIERVEHGKNESARSAARDATDQETRRQTGCFGVLDRRSTKSVASRLRKLFAG